MAEKTTSGFKQKIACLRSLPGGKIFFWGVIIPPLLLIYYLILSKVFRVDPFGWIPFIDRGCYFHRITGLYCPGCGGTRAVRALLSLNPVQSFLYHPLPVCLAGLYIYFMIYFALKKHAPQGYRIFIWLPVICISLNFLVRNILLIMGYPTL